MEMASNLCGQIKIAAKEVLKNKAKSNSIDSDILDFAAS